MAMEKMDFSRLFCFASVIVTACTTSTGILPAGPNTYTVSEDRAPIRGGGTEAQRIALNEANAYCQQKGRVFVPLMMGPSGNLENPHGPTGFTATFQCLVSDDPAVARLRSQQTSGVAVAAPLAPIPDTTLAAPMTTEPKKSNDQLDLDWLAEVSALPGEKFVKLDSSGETAYLVNLHPRTTKLGTRIIFIHVEYKFRSPKLGYISSRDIREVDCNERKSRALGYVDFPERNLGGAAIASDYYSGDWRYDAPNTIGEDIDSIICANPTLKAPRKIAPPKKTAGPKPDFI